MGSASLILLIRQTPHFALYFWGGRAYLLKRLSDGADLYFQSDVATQFEKELDAMEASKSDRLTDEILLELWEVYDSEDVFDAAIKAFLVRKFDLFCNLLIGSNARAELAERKAKEAEARLAELMQTVTTLCDICHKTSTRGSA